MAYDSDSGYYHLTRSGWRRKDEEPWPAERVESYSFDMHQASGWSKENYNFTLVWTDPALSDSEVSAIRIQAGSPIPEGGGRQVTFERRRR